MAASVGMLLFFHAALLAWSGYVHSATVDEMSHLSAGLSYWQFGTFGLYPVNPPLVKCVAALPVLVADPNVDWTYLGVQPLLRAERNVGRDFVRANGRRSWWYLVLGRWACIPLSLLGGYICYRWACELHGQFAGLLAVTLWCFSPNILGNGSLITSDVGAASLGVASCYAFWCWLKKPTWPCALISGAALGIAELTKFTWIILFALWPMLSLLSSGNNRKVCGQAVHKQRGWQLGLIVVLAVYVINLGYGFEGSFQRLRNYNFVSRMLAGTQVESQVTGNRFANSWLGALPVPVPKNYLLGIDLQKSDFENCSARKSYLRGQWRDRGWWYYYLYGLAIKVPLGTWGLVALAVFLCARRHEPALRWPDKLVLLAPLVIVLIFVSSQTGFNQHFRYVLPAFPFAFIWTSQVAQAIEWKKWTLTVIATVALAWSVVSSLVIYPHSLSYFNELAALLPTPADASYPEPLGESNKNHSLLSFVISAGPCQGPRHLLGSNIDWGQDLYYLEDWCRSHPEAQPISVAYCGGYSLDQGKIEAAGYPPSGPEREQIDDMALVGPLPGWYALSVNAIYARSQQYRYFLHFEPVAMAGYSIYIYHITLEEANQVRRNLGLIALPEDGKPPEKTVNNGSDQLRNSAPTGSGCLIDVGRAYR